MDESAFGLIPVVGDGPVNASFTALAAENSIADTLHYNHCLFPLTRNRKIFIADNTTKLVADLAALKTGGKRSIAGRMGLDSRAALSLILDSLDILLRHESSPFSRIGRKGQGRQAGHKFPLSISRDGRQTGLKQEWMQ